MLAESQCADQKEWELQRVVSQEHPEENCDFDKNGSEVWGWGVFLVA